MFEAQRSTAGPSQGDPLVRQWLAHERSTPVDSGERTLSFGFGSPTRRRAPSAVQAACFDIKRVHGAAAAPPRVYDFLRRERLARSLSEARFSRASGIWDHVGAARYHSALLDRAGLGRRWLSTLAADELGVEDAIVNADGRRLKTDGRAAPNGQVLRFLMHRQEAPFRAHSAKGLGPPARHQQTSTSSSDRCERSSVRERRQSDREWHRLPVLLTSLRLCCSSTSLDERAVALGDARWRALLDRSRRGPGTDRRVRR